MNILNSFPVKLCLTLKERTDRQEAVNGEFRVQGIVGDFFYALPGDTPMHSFNISQKAMIKKFLDETFEAYDLDGIEHSATYSHALFFEDDVTFKHASHLIYAFEELPYDWDILYLGANITNKAIPEKGGKYICRITEAWTTHALAYSRRVMEYIYDNFNENGDQMYDDWLSRSVLPKFKCYLINPMVCHQRPSYSDLWGRDTDYTDCFIQGDKIMASL